MEKITATDLIRRYGANATFVLVEPTEITSCLRERGTDEQIAILRQNLSIIHKQYELAEARIRAMETQGMRLPIKLPVINDGNDAAESSGGVLKTVAACAASSYDGDGSMNCPIKLD